MIPANASPIGRELKQFSYLRGILVFSGFLFIVLTLVLAMPLSEASAEPSPDLQALLQELHNPDERKRKYAVDALRKVPVVTPEVVKALGKALTDSSHDVQLSAVRVIRILAPATKPLLPKLLTILENQTESVLVRTETLDTVSAIEGLTPEIIQAFKRRARDSKDALQLRWQAYTYLRLGKRLSGQSESTEEIHMLLIGAMVKALDNPDEPERVEALRLIGNHGPKTPEIATAVSKALFDTSQLARHMAVSAIGAMGPVAKHTLPQLLQLLQTPAPNYYLRMTIPETIAKIANNSSEAITGLLARVKDPKEDLQIRWKSFQTLKKMGGKGEMAMDSVRPVIEKVILEIAQDKKSRKRQTALGFVSDLQPITPAMLNLLVEALNDPKKEVRRAAVSVIQRIGPKAESTVPALISLLKNRTVPAFIRWTIPKTIMKISKNPSSTISPLIERLQDPNEELLIQWKAARVLGETGTTAPSVISGLSQLAENSREPVLQAQAWLSLARLKPHNPEVIQKVVNIAQGQFGMYIPLKSGVLSTGFNPVSNGLQTLIALGEKEYALTSLIALLQREDIRRSSLPLQDVAVLIQKMGKEILPFLPALFSIIQQPSRNAEDAPVKFYLLFSLAQAVPESKTFQQVLKAAASSDPLPGVRQNAQMLLSCFDPQASQEQKSGFPCTGFFENIATRILEK